MSKRRSSVLALVAVAAMLAAGCSKSSDQSSASGSPPPITDESSTGLKPTAAPAVAMGDATHGAAIFSQNCSACHGAGGKGGGVGPVLKGEKTRKNDAATVAWIKNPTPPMPKLYPSPLSEKDVEDVAAYVQTL